MSVLSISVILLCFCSVGAVNVVTNLGELEGKSHFITPGRQIFTFLGVPYARPPVGKHRFEEPKPAKGWSGIWPATEHSSACIQHVTVSNTPESIIGNEDCLYLNIHTPSILQDSNLPVLVFFHGGAFMFGESDIYDPKFLLKNHDIVYVSVNYRLGPFGFLSTQDHVVPGNNGLKDQVLALRWVQENIASFGGDYGNVTISGNSAGGASVHYHYLSPLSRGLFDKGISSSGSVLNPWALAEEPLHKAKVLAASVGCPTNATDLMIRCLKHRPTKQILSNLQALFMPWIHSPFSPFGPVVENLNTHPFLSQQPYKLLKQGKVYDHPWLASVTTEEGLYPGGFFIDRKELLETLNNNWNAIAPHLLDFNYTISTDEVQKVNNLVRKFYFGNEEIAEKTRDKVIEMLSDRLFSSGMGLAARIQASVTSSPVFFYMYGYRGKSSIADMRTQSKESFGTSHLDDLLYIFSLPEKFKLIVEDNDPMIITMTNIWASFINTGIPSPSKGFQWDPVHQDFTSTDQLKQLIIKAHNNTVMTNTKNFANLEFWSSLGFTENSKCCDNLEGLKDEL